MVDLDIIEPFEKPTHWVNGLVIVKKPKGKSRIYLNNQALNNAIKRKPLHLPITKDIFSNYPVLAFSQNWCFLVILANKSRRGNLTSPSVWFAFGRYCFKRLPYRIHWSSEVFQREITFIISDVSGSDNSQDDIIEWDRTCAELMFYQTKNIVF